MKTVKYFLKALIFVFLLSNVSFVKSKAADFDINIKPVKVLQEGDQADAFYYFNMAKAYEQDKSIEKAIESYKLAIKANPNLGSAYSQLGLIYAEKGDYKNSIEIFKKYLNFSDSPEEEELVRQFITQMSTFVKK
jgi:tetratricopeptide (TPR) repeat protein